MINDVWFVFFTNLYGNGTVIVGKGIKKFGVGDGDGVGVGVGVVLVPAEFFPGVAVGEGETVGVGVGVAVGD